MNTPKKNISRLSFLKSAGLMTAGLSLNPNLLSSQIRATLMDITHFGENISDYTIVIPTQANELENQTAKELQQYLASLSSGSISISEEDKFRGKYGIYIGATSYAKTKKVDFANLAPDGYVLKTIDKNLILVGGLKKGLLYGAYDLLEYLGIRKYSPDYIGFPKTSTVKLASKNKTFIPKITYRTTSYSQMANQEYSDWHKISTRADWGLFVHTLDTLVPAKEYGKTHPEYYSLIDGKRQPGTQLCLSNSEVLKVLITGLQKKIAENPSARYWSVSQDDNDRYCQCDACTSLNQKYGDVPSGSIIYFVNQVAKAFPEKIISTLAYWYSRKAPKNIQIEPNVNIMLCNIESARQKPVFETDPAFSNDLKDWGALSKDILIWDYNIQFTNFFAPFPNLYTIKPNIKFYTDNHVNALFMQANNEASAEMALLRSYLICKLMWEPDLDDQEIMNEFAYDYYGVAGKYILQYIESMQKALINSKMQLSIFGDPIHAKESFLSYEMMQQYKNLFDQAEKDVSSDKELLKRVKVARLPIQYAEIQIGRTEINTPRAMFQRNSQGMVKTKVEFRTLVNDFVSLCKAQNVRLVRERSGSPDHFQASYNRIFTQIDDLKEQKSFQKKIIPISQPNDKSKGVESLTDGIFASYESWQEADANWVFYTGNHMDFVLDLGEMTEINSVNMDFLNPQAQPDWHLFALPQYVTYSISSDGITYSEPIKISNPNNPNPRENPDISKISIFAFYTEMQAGTQARYIKVHAESLLKTPSWHIRSGQNLSIYSDQIVVK